MARLDCGPSAGTGADELGDRRDGEIVGREPLATAQERHRQALAELPPQALQLSRGDPAIHTIFENGTK